MSKPKLLGANDEPHNPGAVVAVHYGDYRRQEIWVASGANIGNWYPLGGEFWVVWDKERMPAGVTKSQPTWHDVLARGPVTLLVPGDAGMYREGWLNGRRHLANQIENLADDDPVGGPT